MFSTQTAGWLVLMIFIFMLSFNYILKHAFGISFESFGLFKINGIAFKGIYIKSLGLEFAKNGKLVVLGINSAHIKILKSSKQNSKKGRGNLWIIQKIPFSFLNIFGIITRNLHVVIEEEDIEVEVAIGNLGIVKISDSVAVTCSISGLLVKKSNQMVVSTDVKLSLMDIRDLIHNPTIIIHTQDLCLNVDNIKNSKKQDVKSLAEFKISEITRIWDMLTSLNPKIQVNLRNSKLTSKVTIDFQEINMGFYLENRLNLGFQASLMGMSGSLMEYNLFNLEKASLEVMLYSPKEGLTSFVNMFLENLVISLNQKLLESQVFKSSSSGKKGVEKEEITLVKSILQYFNIQTKLRLSKSEVLFHFLEQDVSVGGLLDSVEIVLDHANQKADIDNPSTEALGHGQILLDGISVDVFVDKKISFNFTNCSYCQMHIGVFMAYDSSEIKLHIQGAFEAIHINLSGIRDDLAIDYRKLVDTIRLKSHNNPGNLKLGKQAETMLKIDGIFDIPVVVVDCKSDLPSTSVRMEIRDISFKLMVLGIQQVTSNLSISNISLIVYKGIKYSEVYRPVKNSILVISGITAEIVSSPDSIPNVNINTEQIQASFGLCDIYILIISFQHIFRIMKSAKSSEKKNSANLVNIRGKIIVHSLEIKWQLSKDVLLKMYCLPLKFKIQPQRVGFEIDASSVEVLVDVSANKYESIFCLHEVTGFFTMSESNLYIKVCGRFLHLNVPYGYKLENVFENMTNQSKALKHLAMQYLEFVPDPYCVNGETQIDAADIPTIEISVQELLFTIQDDPFEIALSSNYMFGYEEQQSRNSRLKEFEKVARLRREQRDHEMYFLHLNNRNDQDFKRELELLDEFNSHSWIDIVKKIRQLEPYPLFRLAAHKVVLTLSAPTLPKSTVEKTLNFMDYTTPPNLIYEELIPRDIVLKFSDLEAKLRNYPFPLVSIPASGSVEHIWETKGLLILVGQSGDVDSLREVEMELTPLSLTPLIISRSMNPIKVYMNSDSLVRSSLVRVTYGASIEPCLSDMIRILDTFTTESIDASPPVGWWDKLRIMIHGLNRVNLKGGEIRVRVLGSFDPYFDPRKSSGTQGIDVCANKGVNIELGGDPISGKDVVIECGQLRLSLPSYKSDTTSCQENNFVRLSGGVRLAIGIRYEILPVQFGSLIKWVRHSEVSLKNPKYGSPGQTNDSFAGFRTKAIHVTFDITSPMQFYSGLSVPLNSLFLTLETINRLSSFAQVYQSVLTNQQVRTGTLYSAIQNNSQKPKLSLLINSIRLKGTAYPLLLSLLAQTEDVAGFVGARIRADQMTVDLRLIQRMILKNTSNQSKTKSTSKWNLQESELDFENLEMCTISSGFDIGACEAPIFKKGPEDIQTSWFTEEDFHLTPNLSEIKIYPFISSPKLIYYRRNQDPKSAKDQENRKNIESYKVQIQLFEERLIELESQIWHCKKLQQAISSRMMVFFDDSLKAESEKIADQIISLYEKKAVIEAYIKRCELKIMIAQEEREDTIFDGRTAPFRHHIEVHNITFLWRSNVRNVIFKLLDMIDRNNALRYCTSYGAVKTVTELIKVKKSDPSNTAPVKTLPSHGSTYRNSIDIKKEGQISLDYVLGVLLKDLNNSHRIFVPNENMESHETVDKSLGLESGRRKSLYPPTLTRLASNLSANNYVASKDPDNPDYVPPDNFAIGDIRVQLINSQISFESLVINEDGSSCLQAVVVTASVMHYKAISILNNTDITFDLGYDDSDKTQNTVKNRSVYSINDAQFFIVRSSDLGVNRQAALIEANPLYLNYNSWPLWVPVECLIDHSLNSDELKRVVENTAMQIVRDRHNPLFVQSKKSITDDSIDVLHIGFPEFEASLTSGEFLVICDTVTNLLIYKDPMRGFRNEQLKKMMIFLDQSQDLSRVLESIVSFQEKIKKTDAFLRFDPSGTGNTSMVNENLRKSLALYQDELFILMEAFKTTYDLETKKGSAAINSKIGISIDKLLWRLLDDNGEFCRLTITNPQFESIGYEDSSASSTLEIDTLLIENLTNTPNSFKNVLSPYISQSTVVDFSKNKMLRLLWKEIPPVAGIQVFHHFEVNIFPLLIQMTFDIGKSLMAYFFPSRGYSSGVKDKRDSEMINEDELIFSSLQQLESAKDLKLMQSRASNNKSFIFIKVPGANHCISYKGSKEKNLEDLYMFPFFLPTLEYRNKTWSWYNFIQEIRRDAIRVIFANTGALVREKIFPRKKILDNRQNSQMSISQSSLLGSDIETASQTDSASIKSKKTLFGTLLRRKRTKTSDSQSSDSNSISTIRRAKSEDCIPNLPYQTVQDNQRPGTPMGEIHDKGRQLFGKFYPS